MFSIIPIHSITAGEGGSVIGSGDYNYGSVVDIEANLNEGFSFHSWHGAEVESSTSPQTTITITGDLS